jgi:hypothetical protein
MATDFDREPSSAPRSGGQTHDRNGDVQKLQAELEYLRRDRDEWRQAAKRRDEQLEQFQVQVETLQRIITMREQQWSEREQQWSEREQQWSEREQQWQTQREELSQQVAGLEAKILDLGLQLKTSQGIEPSTEKGAPLAKATRSGDGGGSGGSDGGASQPPSGGAPSEQKKRYLGIFERPRADDPAAAFASIQAFWQSIGSDPHLIRAPATIFGSQLFAVTGEEMTFAFTPAERLSLFGRERGLHSKKDKTTVYDLRLSLAEITCTQENLRDLAGSMYFRKGNALGPTGCQTSWRTLSSVVTLVCEYAFPMERLAKAIGHSYFSSANISRWVIRSGAGLVQVYVALGKALANCRYFRVDDTSALVLALRAEARAGLTPDKAMSGEEWEAYLDMLRKLGGLNAELLVPVIEAFGRVSQRADETGAKISVNVTLVSTQLVQGDYRSKVYFYRTHFGQAGNLLSRILEHRKAAAPNSIVVQSDRSAQNQIEADVKKRLDVTEAGCMSHARRPVFRYRDRDEELCYYLLRCFAALANIEAAIKRGPLTEKRILRYRQRYAVKIWDLIKGVCQAVVDGITHRVTGPSRWKKDDKLYDACLYVIRHFDALTYYLKDPLLEPDNNAIEQGLRGEKLIESSSLFRKSELGRIALDIHRTFIATCNACHLAYHDFLETVMTADPDDVAAHPERYFPHAIALSRTIRDPPTPTEMSKADRGLDS